MKFVSTRTWYGGPSAVLCLKKSAADVLGLHHKIALSIVERHQLQNPDGHIFSGRQSKQNMIDKKKKKDIKRVRKCELTHF